MAGTVSLGAIQAEIGLDLLGLRSGVGDAKRILQDFGADVSASVTQIGSQMSAGLERSVQESLAKTARQMSQGMKATVQQAKESIFAMTHESGEVQRLKILSRYERDVAGGTPSDMAAQRRDLSLSALEDRERLRLQKMSDMRSKLSMNSFDRERLTAQRDWERTFRESSDPSMRSEASCSFKIGWRIFSPVRGNRRTVRLRRVWRGWIARWGRASARYSTRLMRVTGSRLLG